MGAFCFSRAVPEPHKGWWKALTPFFLLIPGASALPFWAGSWSLSPTPSCSLFLPCTPNPYIDFTVFPFLLFCKSGLKSSHVLTSRPKYAPKSSSIATPPSSDWILKCRCTLQGLLSQSWPAADDGSLKGIPGTMRRNTEGSCEGPQRTRLYCWLELIGDPNSGGIRGYSCVYSDTVQLPWFFLVQNTLWFLVS